MCEYLMNGIWYWCPLWHIQHCVLKWALFFLQILCQSLSEHRNRGQRSPNAVQAEVKLNTSRPHLPLSL